MVATRHAVERYQQRVAAVSAAEASRLIEAAARAARVRPTPRKWTPAAPSPGLLFMYPADLPGVCLLARDGVVLTVFERSQCRRWAAGQDRLPRRGSRDRSRPSGLGRAA